MGRCYEFGVVIAEGCDHVMVVPAEGGKCVCSGCGTECLGRFNGCVSIISQPGYVPLMAPESARTQMPAMRRDESQEESPAQPSFGATAAAAASPEPAVAEIVPIDEAQLERLLEAPGLLIERLDTLGEQISTRDVELGTAFDRFTDGLHRLADELASDREAREKLLEAVERLDQRVQAVESTVTRPIIGFRRSS